MDASPKAASPPRRPALGAWCVEGGVRFRVWAPERRRVEVVFERPSRRAAVALEEQADGTFAGTVAGVGAGDLYRYRLDGEGPFPDPASRFQPLGVHGPSEVIDAGSFRWAAAGPSTGGARDLVLYELHVGTFSPEGTFDGVRARLPHLADLGVTALELMPVADFPGSRNWGYDGVALFAPARCYGRPDDLRRLVDAAHELGLEVFLDVVYNHFGPDGAYHACFSPQYYSRRHRTPWGQAINLDGEGAARVRELFVENALHWVREYRVDGLRLDATHALVDDGPRHFLAELATRVRAGGRRVQLIAEDHRNLARLLRPEADGGFGLDAVWADDFHHQVRRALAGDDEGYYGDFSGTTADIAETLRRGWFYCGQRSPNLREARGTDPTGLPPQSFVICVQNHDQVGNRALGDRLHHGIDPAAYRAAVALLLLAPETPLLFMGQEWAARTPFLFFTDHVAELGAKVTEGRRREFGSFRAFADPAARDRIPDPQAEATFAASRLAWDELEREPHAAVFRLHRALLRLRRERLAAATRGWEGVEATAAGADAVVLRHGPLVVVVQLRGAGAVDVGIAGGRALLSTEDAEFAPAPAPIGVVAAGAGQRLAFSRPGAVVLEAR